MKKRRAQNRVNATGRNNTSRFTRLDHRLLTSNAYRSLSPNARSLLVELTMLDNGENNGSLYLSVRDGAHRMGVADLSAACRSFNDLMELGFIEPTQEAHFSIKAAEGSRARCWRLTWLAGPGRKTPSWTFMEREPAPQTAARKRMERGQRALKSYRKARDGGKMPVLDSGTMVPLRQPSPAVPVLISETLKPGNQGKLPISHVRDSGTHSAATMGRQEVRALLGWWQVDWSPSIARLTYAASIASNRLQTGTNQRGAA